ncbi:MAG: hypothetical protein Q7V53_02555 [Caldisericota bacterium]|nr:hypothetical protein [Caldisericota bacterium]
MDIGPCVTLALAMIDSREAAIIRDRYWRSRTWPVIARERHCSVTTATKRFHQGMDHLRQAIILIEGRNASHNRLSTPMALEESWSGHQTCGAPGQPAPDGATAEWRAPSGPPA